MNLDYPLLIDGGLSNVLEKNGCDLNHELWSAKLLDENEDAIVHAHLEYLQAGAKCLITSSYQATIPGFLKIGFSEPKSVNLIKKTVELAQKAIKLSGNDAFIAASIGPYGAYLADGSEYRGDYNVSNQKLSDFHKSRLGILQETEADWFACETIPSIQECEVLAELLLDSKKPAWMSFSCKDEFQINDGSMIKDCVKLLADHPNIFAIGVNCTRPQHIHGLIKEIKMHCKDIKIVVYPNSGEIFNAETKTWHDVSSSNSFAELCLEWVDAGVDIIGGCCRIGPDHIKELSKRLNQ